MGVYYTLERARNRQKTFGGTTMTPTSHKLDDPFKPNATAKLLQQRANADDSLKEGRVGHSMPFMNFYK